MGEPRIQEVTMLALLFLLLGIVFLLAAAGRIWIDAPPVDSPTVDSAAAQTNGGSGAQARLSDSNESTG